MCFGEGNPAFSHNGQYLAYWCFRNDYEATIYSFSLLDGLRITVQLINAADGHHLWSETYAREMKDVFAIREEIAKAIAQRLEVNSGS